MANAGAVVLLRDDGGSDSVSVARTKPTIAVTIAAKCLNTR